MFFRTPYREWAPSWTRNRPRVLLVADMRTYFPFTSVEWTISWIYESFFSTFHRKDVGRDAIYQLALLRPSSEDRPAFFSSAEICAYVEENWHRICKPGGKKREEYSIAGAPMSASSVADPAVTGKKRDAAGRVVDRFGRQDWRVVLFDRMQEFPTLFRRTTYGEGERVLICDMLFFVRT